MTMCARYVARFRACLIAAVVGAAMLVVADSSGAAVQIDAFDYAVTDADGSPSVQAGAHPYQVTTSFEFPSHVDEGTGFITPDENPRDLTVELPVGLVGNTTKVPRCTEGQLVRNSCPRSSRVGTIDLTFYENTFPVPVFNMVPPPGVPAEFAFWAQLSVHLVASVRTGSDYGVNITVKDLPQTLPWRATSVTMWGVPADPGHDGERGGPTDAPMTPLLTNPTSCSADNVAVAHVNSWQEPGVFDTAQDANSGGSGPVGFTGCDRLHFDPTVTARLSVRSAASPAGLTVGVQVPQSDNPAGLATATLSKAVVTLPAGVSVSAASADGLGACSPGQVGFGSGALASCPDSSKIGSVRIDTPLLDDPLTGSIYLAKQGDNPFGSVLALYVVASGQGVTIKLAGHIEPDRITGQLRTTFDHNPQLPFDSLELTFKDGPRATLSSPDACGTYTTTAQFTSHAGGPAVTTSDSFTLDENCDVAGRFEPSLVAGTLSPIAGEYSPFTMALSRPSGQQDIASVDVNLPPGLLADIGSVALCPQAQAAAGTCSSASQVGKATVAAGHGSNPVYLPQAGKTPTAVFLAGPYKGAPYSLSIVVPAQAGPLDLGTVVVRAALFVDPDDAHVTVKSDPLPTILDGIPLDIQKVDVTLDRPRFTLNPTSCAQREIRATVLSTGGISAKASSPFRVGDCAELAFTPKLALRLTGKRQMRSGGHPSLRAVLTQKSGQANIAKAKVTLPKNVVLDSKNAFDPKLVCDYDKAKAADCPASSQIGRASLNTPILDRPLTGAVHLVQGVRFGPSGNRIRTLPTLLVKLRGEVAIDLRSKTTVDSHNRLVSTFPKVPDAPAKRFSLQIDGGKKGILTVTESRHGRIDLCNSKQTALIDTDGQNGKNADYPTRVKTPCKTKKRKR
jgi:hypothetical protein